MSVDGGAAFPREYQTGEVINVGPGSYVPQTGTAPGMSLRDYFAAHAPKPTDQWIADTMGERLPKGSHYVNALVSWAYFYADAMLAERRRKDKPCTDKVTPPPPG